MPIGGILLFSAHGVSPEIRKIARERKLQTVDATCPLVTKVHLEAIRYANQGFNILLIGHEGHDEVIGTMGEAPESITLVETPEEVAKQLKAYLKKNAPKTIKWELINLHNAGAALVESDSAGVQALAKALETVWGKRPYFKREGGSIGSVVLLQKYVGADSLLTGFGLPDDNVHSPNERMHLPTWYKGIEAFTHFFYNFK